jgi:1-acyl-sn-glycerol-3-phosphate acyltransferase
MLYSLFRGLFRVMFATLFRWQVLGKENIPETGPVILVSNHISNLDPPLLGSPLQRKVSFMAKEQLFDIPVVSFLIRSFGAFPVKRGTADRQSIRIALNILKNDGVVGIFPEGTRSKTGELGKGMSGAALFSLRTDATVIPVAIIGPYRWFRPIRIVYGQPMDFSRFKQLPSSTDTYQQATEYMMSSIQNLVDQHR